MNHALTAPLALVTLLTLPCAIVQANPRGRIEHRRIGESSSIPLLPEAEVTALGQAYVLQRGLIRSDEAERLEPAFAAGYARLSREYGDAPSALSRSLLEDESGAGFDVIEVHPAGPVKGAVVFLHGYAGAFTLLCAQMARAVRDLDVLTVCPATTYHANWASRQGRAIVDATLRDLEGRGVGPILLAGLSSGGVGATLVAPQFADRLAGLVAISGARGPAPGVPALVVQGRRDRWVSARGARRYAQKAKARLVMLETDHWGFLLDEDEVARPVHTFVAARLRSAPSR